MCHDVRIPIPIPWCPYPTHAYLHTYIHVCIIVYVCDDVYIYLIVFVFALFFLLLSLSLFFFSCSLLACGKACPWAEAAGFISCVVREHFILFNYYPVVYMYSMCACISVYCIVYVYVYASCAVYVSNRCMYVHSIVCIVLCVCGPVYT